MKKNYLLIVVIMGFLILSLYSTYAMFTSSVEINNMVDMNTVMNYTFKINGTQELTVSSKSKLRFNAIVQNDMTGKISYGIYYKILNPSTLPDGVIVAEITDTTGVSQGQLIENSEITVPIIIENNSDIEIKVEIGVVTGYATETQGVNQLIYDNGKTPIVDTVNPNDISNNGCMSTLKCTEECEIKQENGKYIEYCTCTNGNEVEVHTVTVNVINGISNPTSKVVKHGGSTIFTVTPNDGCEYESLSCNGGSYNTNTKILTLSNITSDMNCTINFKKAFIPVLASSYIESLHSSNPETMNNDDPDSNVRYHGTNPDNYVRFNDELWRIIGVFNVKSSESGNLEKRVKLIRSETLGNMQWDSNEKNNWATASLQTYLNGTYYNSLTSTAKNLIGDTYWNLGGTGPFNASTSPWFFYRWERGTDVATGNPTYWIGKIGLMYPSDYGYATSGGSTTDRQSCLSTNLKNWGSSNSDCKNNDYLYNSTQWTITTPSSNFKYVFILHNNGYLTSDFPVTNSYASYPVVYLKSTVEIIGGTGTSENPYLLG